MSNRNRTHTVDPGAMSEMSPPDLAHRIEILQNLSTPYWVFDIDNSAVLWANDSALLVWEADSLEELRSRDMSTDMSQSVNRQLRQYQQDFKSGKSVTELWTLQPKGNPVTYQIHMSGIELDDGRMGMLVEGKSKDTESDSITLRKAQVLLHTSVMISMYDEDYNLVYSNPAARAMLTHDTESLNQHLIRPSDFHALKKAVETEDEHTVELMVSTSTGEAWHQLDIQRTLDATTGRPSILISEVNITMRRVAEQRAHSLAYRDTLTGLPNRTFLNEALERELASARTFEHKLAVMFIDLNRFKLINDSLGHGVGDELLKCASRRLKSVIRKSDTIARFGGDEFLILMPAIPDAESANRLAQRLADSLSEPVRIGCHELSITSSIGISIFPDDGLDSDTLMKFADIAMYRAKDIATTGVQRFDTFMIRDMKDRLQLEVDLRRAVDSQQFELHFQPRICVRTQKILCAEALIRWNHPERGMVSPADFIPLAEETGLIVHIGDWVLREAIRYCADWHKDKLDLSVSINISSRQFNSGDLAEQVVESLASSNCPACSLELEITESMLVRETDTVLQTLLKLQDTGVGISIDDFGTGYSNLGYLQEFPIDKLKIDRSFIMNEDHRALVEMIVSLGKMLNLDLVAEGIETEDQATWLKSLDVDEFQGYFFSRPLPPEQFKDFCHAHHQSIAPKKVHELPPAA